MSPTILCGQVEMQALQLAYVSILLCLFLTAENSLPRRKAFHPCKRLWNFFTPKVIHWSQLDMNPWNLTASLVEVGTWISIKKKRSKGQTFLSRYIRTTIWKKYFYFHKCIQYMCGRNPRLYSCLHHVAACIYSTLLYYWSCSTQAFSLHTYKKKTPW